MATEHDDRLQHFTMLGTPLLAEGRSSNLLALAPQLWVHAKVYAGGGERGLHSHPNEDHIFFLLAGRALFRDAEDATTEVGPFEGIMVPRGVQYAFDTVGGDNLVIVRVGAGESNVKHDGQIAAKKSAGAGGTPAVRPGTGVPAGLVFTAP